MLKILNDFLNEDELVYLKKLSENFVVEEPKKPTGNEYDRMVLKDNNAIKSYELKLNNYLKIFKNEYIQQENFWMTKSDNSVTKLDGFHKDICDLTFVSYFDINFTGGEFEYIDENDNQILITLKKNMTLLMTDNVQHRIRPVKSGNRHSLVAFFSLKEKTKKTIL